MAVLPDSAADATIAHQLSLIRYSNGAVQRIIAVLNRADAEIFARLTALLDVAPEAATVEYLEQMLSSVRYLNTAAYDRLRSAIEGEMRGLSGAESTWIGKLYDSVPESAGQFAGVTSEQAYAAAYARPFQGRLLREWAADIDAGRMRRIRDAVRVGFLEGQTASQIVRTIRGTKARNYQDGVIEIDRRHAESVVRTALSHTASTVRTQFYNANADLLGSVMWLSTLDTHTSQMCRVRDHLRYTVETHKPIGHSYPWGGGPGRLHWGCRSTQLALLKGQTELFGQRASNDGPVNANLTYNEWLKRQPAAVQDDVLGPTRGKLFRQGDYDVRDFSNNKGQTYTLDQLQEKDAADFARLKLAA